MKNFIDIQRLLHQELKKTDELLVDNLDSNVELIKQMSGYIIGAGGKRLRPLLLLLCAKATNYKGDKHYLMAVVIELIHTATLLHDDVVDESSTRRGEKTANEVWGNASSVLVGDFLYSRAFEMMVKSDSMQIMQILSKTTNQIAEGEVLQLLYMQNPQLSVSQYYQIIQCKTACLFAAAAQIGALLANNETQQIALKEYGFNLGMAFQVIDDVLDYNSSKDVIGKEIGDDLAEGKATLPIIYALNNTSGDENKLLNDAITNADNSQIDKIVDILHKTKAFDYAKQQAQKFTEIAKQSLDGLQQSEYKDALILLCDMSIARKS